MKCQECSCSDHAGPRFCERCGHAVPAACPTCGHESGPGARFCGSCGGRLTDRAPDSIGERREGPVAGSGGPAPVAAAGQLAGPATGPERLVALRRSAPQALRDKVRAAAGEIAGERKPVTILFTDIVGSTALSEHLDPEEWREILVGAHQCVGEAVHRYEGTLAQLLGDGVLAFFGAPVTHEDDPVRAVRAGLDIQEAIEQYAATLPSTITDFRVRVGIDTGIVVVGQIGHDGQVEYTATGDAVNRAARLQAAARPGTVLISDAVCGAVRHAVQAADRGPIAIRGSELPMRVHEVLGLDPGWQGGRPLGGGARPLVGRSDELATLTALEAAVRAGVGRVVVVTGEPGVGKSRLIGEWRRQLDPGVRWVEADCVSYGEGLPYHLVIGLVRSVLGVTASATEADTAARLGELTNRLPVRVGSDARAFLAHLLSLRLSDAELGTISGLNPQGFQVRYAEAIRQVLLFLAHDGPVVLILEDVHWADAASTALLASLLPIVATSPLLLCVAARPEPAAPGWGLVTAARDLLGASLTEIALQPLAAADVRALISSLVRADGLPAAGLPADVQAVILDRAEGNPLFVEEVVAALFEQGALRRDEQGALQVVDAQAVIAIPDSLNRLLLSRIDRLADEPKRTLRIASVVGREFLVRILEEVLAGIGQAQPRATLLTQLGTLEYTSLIELMAGRPELGYLFRHALVREAAYEAVLRADRRMLHRAAGEALERSYPDRLDELAPTLAYHFERAEARDRALVYLVRAADHASERFANAEAIALYRAAIVHADASETGEGPAAEPGTPAARQSIELRERLGAVLTLSGQHEAARGVYAAALDRMPAEAHLDRARLHRRIGDAWMEPRQMDEAFASFAVASDILDGPAALRTPDLRTEWLALQLSRLWAMYWANRVADMDDLVHAVQPVVEELGTAVQQARFHGLVVLEALRRSRFQPDEGEVERARVALAAARDSGELSEIVFAEFLLGFCHMWRNELDLAESGLSAALKTAERIGYMNLRLMALTYLTVVARRRGDSAGVHALAPRCLTAAGDAKIDLYAAVARANEAWATWRDGDRDGAVSLAAPAAQSLMKASFPGVSLACWPMLAIALEAGDLERAVDAARPMTAAFQFRQPDVIETALVAAVRCADTDGQQAEAAGHLAVALREAVATGYG